MGLVIPSLVKSVTKESFSGISESAWIMAPNLPFEAFQTSGLKRSAALGFLKNPKYNLYHLLEFIENGRVRLEKSKWLLIFIISLMFTFIAEAFALFVFPIIEGIWR